MAVNSGKLHDFVVKVGKKIQCITDGLVDVDIKSENPLSHKVDRERDFPADVAAHALTMSIQHAKTSYDCDRTSILNNIVGEYCFKGSKTQFCKNARGSKQPPIMHNSYAKLDRTVQG